MSRVLPRLDGGAIARALGREAGSVVVLDETGSTNDYMRENASALPAGAVVFAEMQTRGRGRRGREWISPRGANLLFSVLLRPVFPMEKWSRLTHAAALAVARGIEAAVSGIAAGIKWPNDVLVGGRKIAGILLENQARDRFAVVGIGVNVNALADDWPEDLRGALTSLRACGPDRAPLRREEVAVAIVRQLDALAELAGENFPELLDQLKHRSTLIGQCVAATLSGGTEIRGEAVGFGAEGELRVRLPDEPTPRSLSSVEQIRLADPS